MFLGRKIEALHRIFEAKTSKGRENDQISDKITILDLCDPGKTPKRRETNENEPV